MNCKKCNNIVPEGTTVCPFCGEVLVGNEQPVEQAPINNDINNVSSEVASDFNFAPIEPTLSNDVNTVVPEVEPVSTVENIPAIEPTPEVTAEPVADLNSSVNADDVQPTIDETTPAAVESAPTMEPIPETMPSAVESVTEPVVDATPSVNEVPSVESAPVMQTTPEQPMDTNIVAPVGDSAVVEPSASPKKKNGNKMFLIIVIILGIVIAGLVVLVVLKKTNSSDDKKETNKQSEVKDEPQAKVEVKEKDAGEVEVDRDPKVSDDRGHVQKDSNNNNNNPSNNVEYQSNEQQQKNTQFKYFNYGDINFKVPDYIDVVLDSNGDYYVTDNTSYEARFNLIQGGIDEHIQNLNAFVTYLSQQGAAVTDSKIYTATDGSGTKILAVYYVYNNYPGADFLVNVNNQVTTLFEVPVFNQNVLDYMLYDFDYISKNNEILGTFSSTNSKIKDRVTINKSTIKTPKLK